MQAYTYIHIYFHTHILLSQELQNWSFTPRGHFVLYP